LHKKLVENAIHGFDINKYSVQLAACNLTIGAPDTDYERMNLHTLQHGPVEGDGSRFEQVRHGALELLLDEKVFGEIVLEPPAVYGTTTVGKVEKLDIPREFDAVIYNPPFTDTQKQGVKYAAAKALNARLQSIRTTLEKRDPAGAKAIGKRSIRPFFTPLATGLLSGGGRLAKILPVTAVTSKNGETERQYIADNFHVEMVVTSHDPKRINFSENTAVHECLVIGKRGAGNDKPTRVTQLAEYPSDVKVADKLIAAIENGGGGGPTDRPSDRPTDWPADRASARERVGAACVVRPRTRAPRP